jgi:hypothetical protein
LIIPQQIIPEEEEEEEVEECRDGRAGDNAIDD